MRTLYVCRDLSEQDVVDRVKYGFFLVFMGPPEK